MSKVVQEAVNEVMAEMASSSPERKTQLKAKMRVILGDERYCEVMGIPLDALKSTEDSEQKDNNKSAIAAPAPDARPATEARKAKAPRKSKSPQNKSPSEGEDEDIRELQAKLEVQLHKPHVCTGSGDFQCLSALSSEGCTADAGEEEKEEDGTQKGARFEWDSKGWGQTCRGH